MAVDFSHYLPPGVYTNSITGPQLAVNSALPQAVGLVGTSLGYRTFIETIQIPADTVANTTPAPSATLTKAGIDLSTLVVRNLDTGLAFTIGTHYTVTATTGSVSGSSTAKYYIKRVTPTPSNGITQLQRVQISYSYTDPEYYTASTFYDYSDVVAAYGEPYSIDSAQNTWTIQSEISLGAKFAFLNGAYSVVCAAVKPPVSGIAGATEYTKAFQALEDEPAVAVVVPCSGDPALQAVAENHVTTQSNSRFERRAILGVDGSTSTISSTQRITYAVGDNSGNGGILNKRVMLVSPSSFTHFSTELNKSITLGGQFLSLIHI